MEVLITGASSGLGKAMAQILGQQADRLILVARDAAGLDRVKQEIVATRAVTVETVPLDLSVVENCRALAERYPAVDLLINNAGFGNCGAFAETSLEKDLAMINTNIVALHVLTKLYLGQMRARNQGQILNVASIAGFLPGPLMATYYATKNYVVRLSEAIREELRREKSRVKISILCPGPVNTNFSQTANVKFKMRGANSAAIARYALSHLHKFYIVPQGKIKLVRCGVRFAPTTWVARFVYKIQKRT